MTFTQSELNQFTGTEKYHKLTLFSNVMFTDGLRFVALNGDCFWLMNEIAGIINSEQNIKNEDFLSIKLVKNPTCSANLIFTDGNYKSLANKKIDYTDFKHPSIEFFAQKTCDQSGKSFWVVMLPSEY